MRGKKKQSKHIRTRDWTTEHEFAFSNDRTKHRRSTGADALALIAPREWPEGAVANGVVISHTGRWGFVWKDGQEVLCLIDESLGDDQSSLLAPGDRVLVEPDPLRNEPIIRAVAPRKTKLSRLAHVHSRVDEQVVAANIDLLVIVASALKPVFKPGLVDRYMIAAQMGGVEPVLVINKIDLVDEEPAQVSAYREFGMPVVGTSCVTGQGMEELRELLRGKSSVMAGHSGVGKSSLLNALEPDLNLLTQEVSRSNDKGRHTTTSARLYRLPGDILIVDTPGARNLGLWRISPEEVSYYFPEIAEEAQSCRFRDCTHTCEPGCALPDAMEAGRVSRMRFESYLRIRASLDET